MFPPTPTDAMIGNPFFGIRPRPVPPEIYNLFSSQAEAEAMLAKIKPLLPAGTDIAIIDGRNYVGTQIVYGEDGRKLFMITGTTPDPSNSKKQLQINVLVGLLDAKRYNYILNCGKSAPVNPTALVVQKDPEAFSDPSDPALIGCDLYWT